MKTLTKTSDVGKVELLLAAGALDTRINDAGSQYSPIKLKEIAALVDEPQAIEKSKAAFIIPSTYREHDGRSHAAQRERGEYWMLAIDVDEGDPSLTELRTAVDRVTGNASSLFYSSAGATEDNRKWRALIPLTQLSHALVSQSTFQTYRQPSEMTQATRYFTTAHAIAVTA